MKREAEILRETRETRVELRIDLDGEGKTKLETPIGFLNHMLDQLGFHGGFDLTVKATGDTHIDCHHTVEDIGICLGQALLQALGDRKGIRRYAHAYVPMDETLARAVIDLSGRPDFVFDGQFSTPALGELQTQMIPHFFKSFAIASKSTLHMSILYGQNDHHKCEALFKALARSLRDAVARSDSGSVASTKGWMD
ncbi:MAG: imidazoleglycerol-phosphate dehydratase HisB [SAR324 cluster bacterium]|nr:imidazoleglycerol-phosphate dehydratase HisB [SAR324 cluster bacterium]